MFCDLFCTIIFLLGICSCSAAEKKDYSPIKDLVRTIYVLQNGTLKEARLFYQNGKPVYETREFEVTAVKQVDTTRDAYHAVDLLKRNQNSGDAH